MNSPQFPEKKPDGWFHDPAITTDQEQLAALNKVMAPYMAQVIICNSKFIRRCRKKK